MGKHKPKPRLYLRGGTYWARVADANGRIRRVSTHCRDLKAAEVKARELEREGATSEAARAARTTLGDACAGLIASLELHKRSENTLKVQRNRVKHLRKVLGADRMIATLKREDFEKYWAKREADGVAGSTRAAELETLRSALRWAAEHGKYTGDVRRIWPGKLVEGAHVVRNDWLTLPQVKALLAVAHAHLPHRAEYLDAYLGTGVRASELYAIEARHLDPTMKAVWVEGTKTAGARRWVPVGEATWTLLVRRSEATRVGPLFPNWSGSWVQFHKWADDAKIPRFSHNTLRRTYTSLLCSEGVPLKPLSKLLGHSTTAMVEAVYANVSPESLRGVVDRLPSFAARRRLPASIPSSEVR